MRGRDEACKTRRVAMADRCSATSYSSGLCRRGAAAAGGDDRPEGGGRAAADRELSYINRLAGEYRFGKVPDGYIGRGDLVENGHCHPIQKTAPAYREGDLIWREADSAAAREGPAAVSATHIVGDLPGGDAETWSYLVERFCYQHLVSLGMVADWAVHHKLGANGQPSTHPHVHILCTARFWRNNGRHGER